MKSGVVRALVLIFGILMVIVGFVLLFTPLANSLYLAYTVCFLMLVYGISEIAYYAARHKTEIVSGWLLADGIITTVFGALLLFLPGAQILGMSIVFAMWVLFTGVIRTAGAFTAKGNGNTGWGWILAAGIIGILLGIWFLWDPMLAIMTIDFLVPVAFIMQGISAISVFFATSE